MSNANGLTVVVVFLFVLFAVAFLSSQFGGLVIFFSHSYVSVCVLAARELITYVIALNISATA